MAKVATQKVQCVTAVIVDLISVLKEGRISV